MKPLSAIFATAVTCLLAAAAAWAQSPPPASTTPHLVLSPSPSASAPTGEAVLDPNTAFALGLAAYDKGNFAEARKYFSATDRTTTSFALEYNLANTCYQLGDQAAAILHYLRALALDPRDPDARQNLALARQALSISIPDPTSLDRLAAFMSVNAWAWLLVGFGWTTLFLLFLPRLFRWRGALPWLFLVLTLAVSATAVTALVAAHRHARDGVVLHADTPLKLSPTTDSQSIGVLQSGEVAETLSQHGDYYYVRAPDGRLGWVNSFNFTPVYD